MEKIIKKNYFDLVKKIKNDNLISIERDFFIDFIFSARISPYVSAYYVKKGTAPNTITIHMILSGILGGILFSLPNVYFKILGHIFMQLWFILDCSDGEVARETNNYSKFGKELDYTAHIINHPIFLLSFLISMLQLSQYNMTFLIFLFLFSLILEMYFRNLCTLNVIKDLKMDNIKKIKKNKKFKLIKFFLDIFIIYPNFILIGTFIYFFNSNIIIYYIEISIVLMMIFLIKNTLKWLKLIKNS